MPLLRKQPFVRAKIPFNMKPDSEVFYCEVTKEIFSDYDEFFQRTILCNSLVWSCSVTGKSNLTFEEALESEDKARKRIGNLPKPLKKGILWISGHTRRGRIAEVSDDVFEFTKQRYFKGEIIEAVINDQWCDAKITKVIPPTEQEILQSQEEDDEITEVDKDGSPTKNPKPVKPGVPDHLFKYEVEEVEPDDEDMVMLRIIPAEDVKREKGVFTRDKLNLYLKNTVELEGMHYRVKPKVSKMYDLEKVRFEDIFAGPPPQFTETQSKKALLNKNKKGQFTLDGWIKEEKMNPTKGSAKSGPSQVIKPEKKKQTPAELEAEMKRMREAQARYKEEMKIKIEEDKKRRAEERIKENKRKKEEQKIIKELIQGWSRRREDLECEDLKELPKPIPVRCHIPNQLFGEFISILEFLNSFSEMLLLKDNYPGGLTFHELETALTEQEVPDGAFFDILSFMLLTLFDLQSEEIEEAKGDSDKSVLEENEGVLGKDEEVAQAIKAATETANYTKKNLGLALRDCHLDIWSLTEVLRLHLESSGAFRGINLQNWRFQQRGGFRLSDDPGFQFCREEPQILRSLNTCTVAELPVGDKLKILSCLINQMLTYAGVRDEIDTRMDNMLEGQKELREAQLVENKRMREVMAEEKRERKEEMIKKKEETLKDSLNKTSEEKKEVLTDRQKEGMKLEEEKKEKEKMRKEEFKRAEFLEVERRLQDAIISYQNQVYVHCLGRDRAFRRFWTFDTLPGIFVENDDDNIGPCLETPTPWNPLAGPITEEEAAEKAREILSQLKDEDSPEMLESKLAEAKTYSRKPVLKQQTLTHTGALKTEIKKDDESQPKTENGENGEVAAEEKIPLSPPWGRCEGSEDTCQVHSTILPKTHWSFYSSIPELDQLIDSLNPRGIREGELRDRLIAERENMEKRLKKCPNPTSSLWLSKTEEDIEKEEKMMHESLKKKREKNSRWGGAMALPVGTKMQDIVEISLRDQILELEEKIFMGSLGALKVSDREVWQTTLQTRGYSMCCDELEWGGEGGKKMTPDQLEVESRAGTPDSNKRSSTGSNSGNNLVVRQLAAAILQVGQMINDEEKFLKSPLGEEEKERKKRMREEEKKKKEKEAEEDEGIICEQKESILTPFQRWEISLMKCTNIGQLFLHLTTFENSVVWSKSIMNTKCRICRRKTDPDKMLLCDGCDRGHHLYCLKPKLKNVPSGDWFCSDCKPKERIRSPKKKVRRVFSSTESDDEDNTMDEDEKAEDKTLGSGMEDDEDDEDYKNYRDIKKKKPKAKKKAAPEPEPELKKKKKGGIANLFGKRKPAAEVEPESEVEEEEEEEEIVETKSKRGKKNKAEPEPESEEEEEDEEPKPKRGKRNKEEENKENARSKRRREHDDSIELQFNVAGVEKLIKGLMNHKDGWPFDRPITKVDAPDYHKHIKKPMDLGTIRSRLNGLKYACNQEVLDDIRLVFSNCYQYNMEDAEEYQCATRLEKYFEKEIGKMGLSEQSSKPKRNRRTL